VETASSSLRVLVEKMRCLFAPAMYIGILATEIASLWFALHWEHPFLKNSIGFDALPSRAH
jgi:hypothetical protein